MKGKQSTGTVREMVRAWAVCGAMVPALLSAGEPEAYQGPCSLVASKDAGTLYVAAADARQLLWVELPGGKVTRRVCLPAEPCGLVPSPDGALIFVTCAAPRSTVVAIDATSGEVTASFAAGHTATGPAVAPDGKRLYVCNRFDNDVSVIDLPAGKEVARVKAVREPVAAAVTPDGKTVLVANHLAYTRTDASFYGTVAPVVTVIDARTHETGAIQLANGSHSLRDLCVSPDGKYAYVTHVLCNFQLVPMQVDMGWINSNVISVIDVGEKKLIQTVGLDEMFLGAGNPWGVACTADGASICISHAGSHELSVVEAASVSGRLFPMFTSPDVGAIPDDPVSNSRPPRRIKLPGKGPRGVAVAGSKVYVAEYFSDTLAVVDLEAPADEPPGTIALGPPPQLTLRRRGQLLFNDATICYQHWQ
ncbi:MAG TPA: YncE family protein, partial [Thermoguttaceae bacterium]|nr:YncE family protein [Thermoguttaceae bacterium]